MKFNTEEKRILRLALVIITSSLAIFTLFQNLPDVRNAVLSLLRLISPFLIALVMAFIVNIPMKILEEKVLVHLPIKKSLHRTIAMVLSYLFVVIILYFVLSTVIPQMIDSIQNFINNIPPLINRIETWFAGNETAQQYLEPLNEYWEKLNTKSFMEYVKDFLNPTTQGYLNSFFGTLLSTISTVFSTLLTIFLAWVFSIYILASKETLGRQSKELLYSILPEKSADNVMYITYTAFDNFYNFFTGQFIEALLLAVMCFSGMTILNFPYAIVISVLTAFGALIPMVGAVLPGILGSLMILTVDPLQALSFLIFIVVLQQFEGNIVYPKVVGKSIGLPALWVLFAVFFGGAMYGVLGLFLFVPLASTLYDLLTDFKNRRLAQKKIDIATK